MATLITQIKFYMSFVLAVVIAAAHKPAPMTTPQTADLELHLLKKNFEWSNEEAIEIVGIPANQNAMEPQITLDGQFLFFNNGNGDGRRWICFMRPESTTPNFNIRSALRREYATESTEPPPLILPEIFISYRPALTE